MITIFVGSTNPSKVQAVDELTCDYSFWENAVVEGKNVSSDIHDQPISLEETIKGASNRAHNAFKNCDFSVGIEDGIFPIPPENTLYANICACVIFDGQKEYLGFSSVYLYDQRVIDVVLKEKMALSPAFNKVGYTKNEKIGNEEGLVGLLTNGRVPRKDYTKQAIINALIMLENKGMYSPRVD